MLHLELRWQQAPGVDLLILLVDVPFPLSVEEVAERLYSEHAQSLAMTDVLVVRAGVASRHGDIHEGAKRELVPFWRERAPRSSVHLLYLKEYEAALTANCNENAPKYLQGERERTAFVDWLREEELKALLRRSSAVLGAKNQFVYRSPSGKYCTYFLRVGNIQTGRQPLDSIGFWLVPFLRDVNAVVTDTWSISSLALNALRMLQLHDPSRSAVVFETLSTYQDGSAEAVQEARDALSLVTGAPNTRVLVLVSTVMTGSSLDHIRAELTSLAPNGQFDVLALFKLGSQAQLRSLCDLSAGLDGRVFDSLDQPPPDATVIEIDPKTYFPLHVEETFVNLGKPAHLKVDVDAVHSLLGEYQGQQIFSVHRNAVDLNEQKLRHHATYIDLEPMLRTARFQERLSSIVASYESPPLAIFVPPHNAGIAFANTVKDLLKIRFQTDTQVIVHVDLTPGSPGYPGEMLRNAGQSDSVLVVDDVSVSGQRLARFQAHLREEFRGRVHYLVGVARPESNEEWRIRCRNLRYRDGGLPQHTVENVEFILLPNWSEPECPWCQELGLLEAFENAHGEQLEESARGLLAERRRALLDARTNRGLSHGAFWRVAGNSAPSFTANSLFLPNRNSPADADIFAAVASVIQRLRSDNNGLHVEYPHISILNPDAYLGTTFNDVILRMGILRAARRAELVGWKESTENERKRGLSALLTGTHIDERDRDALRLEFLVAIMAQKLPRVPTVEDDTAAAGAVGELLQIVNRR
jgi:hypothetical protein